MENKREYPVLKEACRNLRLSRVHETALEWEETYAKEDSHLNFLTSLLHHEWEQRLKESASRRIKAANFPKIKTIESFDFIKSSHLPENKIRNLLIGNYIAQAEPIILLGEPGTGKTHLATAFGYAAATQGSSVKFVTAAKLANDLVEAKDGFQLNRLMNMYRRTKLLIIDELGYLPLRKQDAELIFQLLSDRHELLPLIITTNLPFNEWTTVFTDKRLCRALLDRITHRAHIIETGIQSARLAESLTKKNKK